jgi:hypothetical protein
MNEEQQCAITLQIVLISQLHRETYVDKILMKIAGRTWHDADASSRNFNARISLKSQVISNGICGGRTGIETDFPLSTTAMPC